MIKEEYFGSESRKKFEAALRLTASIEQYQRLRIAALLRYGIVLLRRPYPPLRRLYHVSRAIEYRSFILVFAPWLSVPRHHRVSIRELRQLKVRTD